MGLTEKKQISLCYQQNLVLSQTSSLKAFLQVEVYEQLNLFGKILSGHCKLEYGVIRFRFSSPPAESTSAASNAQPTESGGQSLEEKTKYAQERLKEIRERKQAEAQKAEIEKEKRRKEQMSQLSRAKVEADDREAKQVMEERRKEKEEERLAREAIKRRIAEDRAERAGTLRNSIAYSKFCWQFSRKCLLLIIVLYFPTPHFTNGGGKSWSVTRFFKFCQSSTYLHPLDYLYH